MTGPSARLTLFELLIFRRCEVAQLQVKPFAIIEDLSVFKDFLPGVLALVDLVLNQLRLQGFEERFRARVVLAVAPAPHAMNETAPLAIA